MRAPIGSSVREAASYASLVRWLRRHRAACLWVGAGLAALAILVAVSSTAFRGESSRDFPTGGSSATSNGTGSDNMLALGSLVVAVVATGGTVLISRITRPSASAVDRDSRR